MLKSETGFFYKSNFLYKLFKGNDKHIEIPSEEHDMGLIKVNEDVMKTINHRLNSQPHEDIINHWHEEVGELMQAINKHRRHKPDALENLREEIGDVLIMTLSLREIFNRELVDEQMKEKTNEKIRKHGLK